MSPAKVYLRLISFMKPYWRMLVCGVILMLVCAVFSGFSIGMILPFVNVIFSGGETHLGGVGAHGGDDILDMAPESLTSVQETARQRMQRKHLRD